MRKTLAALFWLAGTGIAAAAPPAPALDHPLTIAIENRPTPQHFRLKPGQDYIFRIGPSSGGFIESSGIKIVGGRNIVIVGGHIKRPDGSQTNDPETGQPNHVPKVTLNLLGQTGTTYVAGLLVDNNGQFGADGIDFGGADIGGGMQSGDFVLHDVRIEGIAGTVRAANGHPVAHADGVQFWGPVRSLTIDDATIVSSYQGLNLQPEFPLGHVTLNRVNLRYPPGEAHGYAFWLGDGQGLTNPTQYELHDVYVAPRGDGALPWQDSAIAPDTRMPNGARMRDARTATWDHLVTPDQTVDGHVTLGIPPQGDYCPAARLVDAAGLAVYTP